MCLRGKDGNISASFIYPMKENLYVNPCDISTEIKIEIHPIQAIQSIMTENYPTVRILNSHLCKVIFEIL